MYMKDGGSKNINLLLGLIFLFLIVIWLIPATVSVQNDMTTEFDYLKTMILDSPDECWRKPAQNRKNTMYDKVESLESLIIEGSLEKAYDKLKFDIKPKLTGLRADENDIEWDNGIFKNAWVQCSDLMENFRIVCDSLLMKLNPLHIDDETPPAIDVDWEGEGDVEDPGTWSIYIEDLETGLKEVEILVDGDVVIYENYLFGISSVFYEVNTPAVEGNHMLTITAINNDLTPDVSSETVWVLIEPSLPPDPPPPPI